MRYGASMTEIQELSMIDSSRVSAVCCCCGLLYSTPKRIWVPKRATSGTRALRTPIRNIITYCWQTLSLWSSTRVLKSVHRKCGYLYLLRPTRYYRRRLRSIECGWCAHAVQLGNIVDLQHRVAHQLKHHHPHHSRGWNLCTKEVTPDPQFHIR